MNLNYKLLSKLLNICECFSRFEILKSAILENTHDSATGCFQRYLFSRRDKIHENLKNFVPQKFLAIWYIYCKALLANLFLPIFYKNAKF